MNSLRQAVAGGATTGSVTNAGDHIVCTGNFTSTTLTGSLLICVAYSQTVLGKCALSISTPGLTWNSSTLPEVQWGTSTPTGYGQIFYCQNAPSLSNATATSVQLTQVVGGAALQTVSVECTLYEVTGALLSGSIVQVSQNKSLQTGATVSAGTTSPIANDFMITMYNGNGGGLTAGAAGWTLGPNPSVVGGGSQYIVNAPGGSLSGAFTGTLSQWCAETAGFKTQPVVATGSTHGFFFGD